MDRYRDAGLQVEASCDLDDVAQEAMTNALQHAPGAPMSLHVHLDHDRSAICLSAENLLRDHVP